MINKGCEVNYCFKNGFILGEEHLQTLSSKIKERYPGEELIYKITKNNSYVFQTLDINEIFKEENNNANIINKLDIIIDNDNTINFNLCFEKGEETSLKIIGDNKDKVFLLYNEIKTYVEKEITTVKTFFKYEILSKISETILLLGLFIFMFVVMLNLSHNEIEQAKKALASSDTTIKLNYMIERQINNLLDFDNNLYICIVITVLAIFVICAPLLLKFLFGKNGVLRITDYFLFGKQKNIYDKKIKIKSNIIWGVVIAFFVSIIAGIIVYLLTQ